MKRIRVTLVVDGPEFTVNIAHITYYFKRAKDETCITFMGGDEIIVAETPEEIDAQIDSLESTS